MKKTIYLEKRRIEPVLHGADFKSIIATWEAAQDHFSGYVPYKVCSEYEPIIDEVSISIDASEIIDGLKQLAKLENAEDDIVESNIEQMIRKKYKFALNIETNDEIQPSFLLDILRMFLQELFLAMNISGGPCLDLGLTKYVFPEEWSSIEDGCLPSITPYHFEVGWLEKVEWGWPQIQTLEFNKTWSWLDQIGMRGLGIAKQSSQLALFNILYLESSFSISGPPDILLLSQAIESLFSTTKGNIVSNLKERISLLHGQPADHKNWVNKFYDLRSRIIHGNHPVFRPPLAGFSKNFQAYSETDFALYEGHSVRAFLLIIATIQDLIRNSAKGYTFRQDIERIKCVV